MLIVGALVLNEFRRGLIEARVESLTSQGQFIANLIARSATVGEPQPALDRGNAATLIQLFFIPQSQRARLFDAHGNLIADSDLISDRIEARPLPPPARPSPFRLPFARHRTQSRVQLAQAELKSEIAAALKGAPVSRVRIDEDGGRVVSVSIPIQRVEAVLGVLVLEAGDVDQIVAAQRRALLPFILIAVAVTLASSWLLNNLVARPVLRLSRAADQVRQARARAISLPDLEAREDEIGDLARSLEAMTSALSARMDAIEAFAADVSHEIKNPLTSIRSAIETLEMTPNEEAKARLLRIVKQDVTRLDRLITDISNASRLDAELSRESPRLVDLPRLLADIAAVYPETPAPVRLAAAEPGPPPAWPVARGRWARSSAT